MVAVVAVTTDVVVMVKVTELAPAGTLTVAGTGAHVLLDESAIGSPTGSEDW
jgi:hypothetical protein